MNRLLLEGNAQVGSRVRNLSTQPPIRDYALIGDCHGCALVSRSGSIDWCAFGRFDAPPVFCRLLDAGKGGFLSVRPVGDFEAERSYLGDTTILRTTFTTTTGKVAITDYMPLGRQRGASAHDYVSLLAPGLLTRTIEGVAGEVDADIRFRPSIDYARTPARLVATSQGVFAENGPALYADLDFGLDGDLAQGSLAIRAGERRHLVVTPAQLPQPPSPCVTERLLEATRAFWSEWIAYCRYNGPYRDMVRRSALTLKLLTYAPTGAIVAAPTTSLPEEIGGERNWDYRYCWLRDASFTLYALAVLGYSGEAKAFGRFLKRVCSQRPTEIQIMYGIGAEMRLEEQALEHLEGYCGSRPVRIGNAAYKQRQIDVHGEFVDWAHLTATLGGKFDSDDRALIKYLVSFVAAHIHEPDQGLWEARSDPRHYVYSKMMGWVALDRGLRLLGDQPEWSALRDRLKEEILRHGVDPEGGHILQAYDYPDTDAALLLAPMLGFPVDHATLERSVAAIEMELRRGDYVERYRTADGLAGDEGAFLICSFWLVDAYLALGKEKEARDLFERLIARANDVGLFAEEIDPLSHDFLGNFPQAFTHLALIGNAIHLHLREKYGADALSGTNADRARRAVGATFGWRAIWQACKASGRVGRFWSSRQSILPAKLVRQLGVGTHG
jgi:GH15 family glucan-1,4-alpha-glucosidase